MVSMRSLALVASTIIGATSAAPLEARQYTPGTLNNTREFYVTLKATTPNLAKYDGWGLQAYHTGAGLADPVFAAENPSPAYLNGTSLLFDVSTFPFGVNGLPSDTNYGRWEPITIAAGYGTGSWVKNETHGIQVQEEEFDGWLVCEWYHGNNAPQLFQFIAGFDGTGAAAHDVPSSCGPVLLIPKWI